MVVPFPEDSGLVGGGAEDRKDSGLWPPSSEHRRQTGSRICKSLRGKVWTMGMDVEGSTIRAPFSDEVERKGQDTSPKEPQMQRAAGRSSQSVK